MLLHHHTAHFFLSSLGNGWLIYSWGQLCSRLVHLPLAPLRLWRSVSHWAPYIGPDGNILAQQSLDGLPWNLVQRGIQPHAFCSLTIRRTIFLVVCEIPGTALILLDSEWLAWWYSDFPSSKETCLTSTCCHCEKNGKQTLLFSGSERAIWVSLLNTKPGLNFKLTKSEGHQKLCPVNSSSIVSRQFWWKGFSKGWKHQTLFVYIETLTAFIVFVCKISLYRKS